MDCPLCKNPILEDEEVVRDPISHETIAHLDCVAEYEFNRERDEQERERG